jgi:regulator of nucleoside diphosphate kinase
MSTTAEKTTASTDSIILTTGMFDLLKDQIRRKKLAPFNEAKLVEQLRNAQQVLRKELPDNVVDINRRVRLTDLESNETLTLTFVAPDRARRKNKTESILSPVGLALIGYREGAEVPWEMPEGVRRFRIEEVSAI